MSLKSLIVRYIPDSVLNAVKRVYYLRALKKSYEDKEQDLIVVKRLVRPGDCAVDIGANIGVYTKVLSEVVGAQGLVISLEPVPDTFKILSYCVNKLGLSNVRAINSAVSEKAGTMSMSVPRYAGVGHYNYYQARLVVRDAGHSTGSEEKTGREYHNISVRTLDEVLKDSLHPVTFVKCDVEGHELAVLLGSRTVLERWSPAWLVEVAGSPEAEGSSAAALFDLMRKAGYESWIFSDGRLRRRVPGDKWLNYFFLKEDHLPLAAPLLATTDSDPPR